MNRDKLINFINSNAEPDDFTGGIDIKQIENVQDSLKLKFPESYKWFLNDYGSGGLYGIDILGVAKSNISTVVIETESYRDLGLNDNLVVIEDVDEFAYCLDTSKMENNECPVVAWNKQGGLDDFNTAENFYEFLLQRLLDAKEVWEEDF
ncbi:SMI1/KNR4 family protein [Bacillus sp. N1-1]|jgi:antitoxin YobK|uniref:SMI1/KNR4 family protein n=1 Tax=Bacillus sp. N1-1 TaxID=2682541 RepID=UPI0013195EDC|nr:SMI1/KNR4 family protein [Bacillus sp. N1-1]QHA93614.1 SMI1/KNR4 family protein [Bacillus sp. N1-1]